jgi:protein-S-isoprenylcysteine O-methyltransferase Ste14
MTMLGRYFASNRILVSRVFAVAFALVLLSMSSAHDDTFAAPILLLLGLLLVGIATVGRLWCSLYISGYKDSQLITSGPYSLCRNPLYFFSLLGFAGVGFATETVTLGIVLTLLVLVAYPSVIAREEAVLSAKFGAEFERYCATTPRLLPRFGGFVEPETYTVNPRLFRRTMGDVVWFIWLIGIIELVEALHELHVVEPLIRIP